jgi:hypothetical protein
LEPLLKNPRVADRTTIFRGVQIARNAFGTDGNEHDMGFARMFTGEPLVNIGGHPWGGGPSVDQMVAAAWGVESLALRVVSCAAEPFPKPGFLHRNSFVYSGPARHKSPYTDPFEAYDRLFVDPFADNRAQRQRILGARRSMMGVSVRQLDELSRRLGQTERHKLGLHAAAVRQLEQRIALDLQHDRHPGASCARKPKPPRQFGTETPDLLVNDESAVPEIITSMLDLIVAGFACDLTRIATLQFGYAGNKWSFDWLGIGQSIHDLAHLDNADAGSSPETVEKLVSANRFYAAQVADLALKLDAIPEADGSSMLDNTLIVWANEFGRGDHSLDNVPIVLIGGRGVGLPTGRRVVDAGPQPFQRVGCTVLNLMGVPAAGFGDELACGTLQGL